MAAVKVKLPDFVETWPWQRELNPHYEEAKREANEWAHSFGFFDAKSQDAFDRCEFAKLAMLTYPYMNREQSIVACKLMVLFYVYDEYTDVEDGSGAGIIAGIVMDAIRNPEKARPVGEFPVGELARQFWAEASALASPMAKTHFVSTFQQYVDAVTLQAQDRDSNRIRSIDEFWAVRDHTGGCLPSFCFVEFFVDFPEEVYRHPMLERIREIANRSIAGCNDVYSYNIERARGHALHNILTAIMYEKNLQVAEAAAWFNDWHNSMLAEFLTLRDDLDSLIRNQYGDEIASQVRFYVDGLGRWIRGSDDWHFEGERHFGSLGREIQKTKEILMLPRVDLAVARLGIPTTTTTATTGKKGDEEMVRDMMEQSRVASLQIEAAMPGRKAVSASST